MGRVEHRQERGARLFLYPSLWEPLFAWSIHHNDRNPQTHLLLLSSYPLFSLSLHSATLFFCIFHCWVKADCCNWINRLYIEASHTEIAYWLTITILSMHSWLWQQAHTDTHTHSVTSPPSPKGYSSLHKFCGLPYIATSNSHVHSLWVLIHEAWVL